MADSEELKENGAMAGSTSSIQLNDISGDKLTGRDVTYIYGSSLMSHALYHDVESEARGQGKKCRETCQGNLKWTPIVFMKIQIHDILKRSFKNLLILYKRTLRYR